MKEKLRKLSRIVFPKKRVIRIFKMHKEASNRDYYRIFLSGKQTCVAMILNDITKDPYIAEKIIDATNVFASYKISVPTVYRYFKDDNIFFIKDIGVDSLETFHFKTGAKTYLTYYKTIIDKLIEIHNSKINEKHTSKLPFTTSFTKEKFNDEFNFFIKHSNISSIIDNSKIENIKSIFDKVSEQLTLQKYVLTHRDLHSRNIKVKDESFSILDHQDARMGPYTYDLVSLIKDSYVNLSTKEEATLITYYIEVSKKEYNSILDENIFFKDYYSTLFQRSVKAAGTFYYQTKIIKNKKFKKYIPTVLTYAINSLQKLNFPQKEKDILETSFKKLLSEESIN